jgi:DNA polymerase III epsilon subunit family exonuclease
MSERAAGRIHQGPLVYSMFHTVLFPPDGTGLPSEDRENLTLRRVKRFVPRGDTHLYQVPIVVVDVETTGLDPKADQIIEIGAIKMLGFNPIDQFDSLIASSIELTDDIVRLTGITPQMLKGQPPVAEVLRNFLKFIEGSILVAHNAEFDMSMIKAACSQIGIDLEWPIICTLKLARELLPELENKKLDTLARHYDLKFDERHRAIGDIKVTCGVFRQMLAHEAEDLTHWQHFKPFIIE